MKSFFSVTLAALSILRTTCVSRAAAAFCAQADGATQPAVGQPDLVGHCVNLLPFVVDLDGGESVGEMVSRVQTELAAAQDHSAYSLIDLLDELHPVATSRGVPPASVGLTNVKKFQEQELPQRGFAVDYDANPMNFQSFEWWSEQRRGGG